MPGEDHPHSIFYHHSSLQSGQAAPRVGGRENYPKSQPIRQETGVPTTPPDGSLSPSLSLPTPAPAFSHPDATFPCRFAASPAPSLPTPNRAASPLRFPPTLSPNREEGSVPCSAWLHGFPACWSLSGDSEPEVECLLMVFFDGGGREREEQDGGGGGGGYQRGH